MSADDPHKQKLDCLLCCGSSVTWPTRVSAMAPAIHWFGLSGPLTYDIRNSSIFGQQYDRSTDMPLLLSSPSGDEPLSAPLLSKGTHVNGDCNEAEALSFQPTWLLFLTLVLTSMLCGCLSWPKGAKTPHPKSVRVPLIHPLVCLDLILVPTKMIGAKWDSQVHPSKPY